MAHLIGRDFTPPDLRAKVTGRAKYAEDFRADSMLFCRLLTSPMPHARVRSVDLSELRNMDGVVGILTADELPEVRAPGNTILTNEPLYVGAPILAVAAVNETVAQNAIAAISVDLEPLPFCVDPLESLRPDGPNARTDGNIVRRGEGVVEMKWTAEDFDAAGEGQMPMGSPWRSGRTAMSKRGSRTPHSCSTSPSSLQARRITPWSHAARWRTGRTGNATCTARPRARPTWSRGWRVSSGSNRRISYTSPSSVVVGSGRRGNEQASGRRRSGRSIAAACTGGTHL